MAQTKKEIRTAWDKVHFKRYTVNLRYDTDQAIIDYIESHKEQCGTTEIFRMALEMLIESGELG